MADLEAALLAEAYEGLSARLDADGGGAAVGAEVEGEDDEGSVGRRAVVPRVHEADAAGVGDVPHRPVDAVPHALLVLSNSTAIVLRSSVL